MTPRLKRQVVFGLLLLSPAIGCCTPDDPAREAAASAAVQTPRQDATTFAESRLDTSSNPTSPSTVDTQTRPLDVYGQTLLAIAQDIQHLAKKFPALRDFDPRRDVDLEWLRIHYSFKAPWTVVHHRLLQEKRPVPEDDGLWFHIDFHESVEMNERASQVFRGDYRNHGRRVMVVLYTGKKTEPVRAALWRVLAKHGTTAHVDNP